jgi:hypothetical protein
VNYADWAGYMWGEMKAWLAGGGIDVDPELETDLTNRRYAYKMIGQKACIVLEPKDGMKQRGLASPDDGDALALTFALPVQQHSRAGFQGANAIRGAGNMALTEYDPFNNPVVAAMAQGTDYNPHG